MSASSLPCGTGWYGVTEAPEMMFVPDDQLRIEPPVLHT